MKVVVQQAGRRPLKRPRSLEKAIVDGIRKVAGIDKGEVADYLDECVAGVAAFHAQGNLEYSRVEDGEYWDAMTDGFEAGVAVGAALKEGESVFTACVGDEDGASTDNQFWFTGPSAQRIAADLRHQTREWVAGLRKDRNLLPFE